MKMNRNYFSTLFLRYVNDQATEEEINELMRMVKSGRYDAWIKVQIDSGLEGGFLHTVEADSDLTEEKASELLQHILGTVPKKSAKVTVLDPFVYRYQYPTSPSTANWRWVAVAAVILLTAFSWLYLDGIVDGWETVDVSEFATQEIITNRGERTSLILGDGTRISLNADSRLQIPQDYGQHYRSLVLDGEAFFEVEHNPEKPFRVHTKNHVYTEVLGTRFNVRSYEASINGRVDVVVVEGRVRLGSEDQSQPNSVVVNAGQKGAIGPNGAISVMDVSGLDEYVGWVEGQLVFSDQQFEEIIRELERWYDIEITVTEPELLQRRMSATFEGDDSLSGVLLIISQALQIDFTRKKRMVQFGL